MVSANGFSIAASRKGDDITYSLHGHQQSTKLASQQQLALPSLPVGTRGLAYNSSRRKD